MAPQSSSRDFIKLFHSSQKDLNSEKFYDAMDMESTELNNYEQICNEIKVRNHADKMKLICKKYIRFLDTSKAWSGLFYVYDISLLLNYWLYDKVTNIYGTTESDVIGIAFTALQRVWDLFPHSPSYDPYYHKCKPEPKKVNHEDWENRKKLYDYYVDFDTLFGQGRVFDKLCEVYYKKIKEMIQVCAYFQEQCSASGTHNCPDNFNKCVEKDIKSELEKFSCRDTVEARNAPALAASSMHPPTGPKLESAARGHDTALPEHAASDQDTQSISQSSGIGKNVAHSVLGAAPVVLTATMLYRYTPLGPWIRRFGGGRTNSMNAMDTFSSYTQEAGNMFSEDSANYISYQPI